MDRTYYSPRHPSVALQQAAGSLVAWACPETGGVFLASTSVYHLLQTVLGMDFGVLKASPEHPEGRDAPIHCPECSALMKTVALRGVPVDYCVGCGSLWFDPGELHQLTEGRFGVEAGQPVPLKKASRPTGPTLPPPGRGVGLAPVEPRPDRARAPWANDEPVALMDGLYSLVGDAQVIRIEQGHTQAELMFGWDSANTYHAMSLHGEALGHMTERSEGVGGAATRILLGSRRPLVVEVVDRSYRQALMDIKRPFGLWPVMTITTATGRPLGTVQRRLSIHRRYALTDDTGRAFATIQSPLLRFWTFHILDHRGQRVGALRKKWSGFIKEAYTSADNFELDFGARDWTLAQRCVIFAAAVSVDFDYFERPSRGSLSAGLLTS